MKRKQLLVFVIIAFALAFTFGVGGSLIYAQGQFSGYKSTIQTYNMSDTTANVILAFYRQDGSLEKTLTDIIERDRSKIYFTLPVAEGFTGSVVISSNQPVAALSSMMNSGLTAGGTYPGRSQGSTTVYLPLLMANQDGGFNSWFTLQNASASSHECDGELQRRHHDHDHAGGARVAQLLSEPGAAYEQGLRRRDHERRAGRRGGVSGGRRLRWQPTAASPAARRIL